MTTGTTIVSDSLLQLGVIGKTATIGATDLAIGLRALNRMLDSDANVKTKIFGVTTESFPFVADQAAYTTAVLTAGRPVSINYMYITLSDVSYPCQLITNQSYDDIGYKPASGIPSVCYYDPAYPAGTMTFFPVPYSSSLTCVVDTNRVLIGAISAGTTVALPPGYEKAIIDNLTMYLQTYYPGSPLSPNLIAQAKEGWRVLKALNYAPLVSDIGWARSTADAPTQWLPPW